MRETTSFGASNRAVAAQVALSLHHQMRKVAGLASRASRKNTVGEPRLIDGAVLIQVEKNQTKSSPSAARTSAAPSKRHLSFLSTIGTSFRPWKFSQTSASLNESRPL